jgi:hypothetical protein
MALVTGVSHVAAPVATLDGLCILPGGHEVGTHLGWFAGI